MIVRTEKELDYVVSKLEKAKEFSFDTEYVDRGFPNIHLVGMSMSWDGKDGAYIPVGHNTGENQLPKELVLEKMKPILENPEKVVILQNIKADVKSMWVNGVYITDAPYWNVVMPYLKKKQDPVFPEGFSYSPPIPYLHVWDTMIAQWMLDCTQEYGLKAMSLRHFGHKMTEITDLAKEDADGYLRVDLVKIQDLGEYAWDDAIQTFRLKKKFEPEIKKEQQEKIFYEYEMPFACCIAELEIVGVPVNKTRLEELGEQIKTELDLAIKRVYSLRPSGEEFNIGSTKQLNQVLFDELQIPPVGEPNKRGEFSTKAEIMEQFQKKFKMFQAGKLKNGEKYEICDAILRYRKTAKLYSTYIESLIKFIDKDGRLHCNFWQTGTKTGRLSSSQPNLQNIPNNDEFPIRSAFYAPTKDYCEKYGLPWVEPWEWVWNTFDESQLELRVGAHLTKDPTMIQLFKDGGDMHSMTAIKCYKLDCSLAEVKHKFPIARQKSKKINFGVFYCMGNVALADGVNRELKDVKDYMSKEEAQMTIDNFMTEYKEVAPFMESCRAQARKTGRIKTIIGRYRVLNYIGCNPRKAPTSLERSRWFEEKNKDERRAVNTPVQGSGADIVGLAMRNMRKQLMESKDWFINVQMVMQVHDEVSSLIRLGHEERISAIIKEAMETPVKLRVPLVAEGNCGVSWLDCH